MRGCTLVLLEAWLSINLKCPIIGSCTLYPTNGIGSKSRALIQRVHFSHPSPRCPREVLNVCPLHTCVLEEEEASRERDAAVGEVKCTG